MIVVPYKCLDLSEFKVALASCSVSVLAMMHVGMLNCLVPFVELTC